MDRAAKQLTIAVWAVAIALIVNAVALIIPWLSPPIDISRFTDTTSSSKPGVSGYDFSSQRSIRGGSSVKPFYKLPIEEQIEHASMVAVAEYQEGDDGRMRAVIREILKKNAGTVSFYHIDDEHPMSSYYPSDDRSHGDGVIIFFTGSPATMSLSMTYEGDRIRSLGDMPLALFREKCSE